MKSPPMHWKHHLSTWLHTWQQQDQFGVKSRRPRAAFTMFIYKDVGFFKRLEIFILQNQMKDAGARYWWADKTRDAEVGNVLHSPATEG